VNVMVMEEYGVFLMIQLIKLQTHKLNALILRLDTILDLFEIYINVFNQL